MRGQKSLFRCSADRSGHVVRSLERWDRGFESHLRHGYLYFLLLFCICVVLCVGSVLATG
jgi:hypothetical protein